MNTGRRGSSLRHLLHAFFLVFLLSWAGVGHAQATDPVVVKAEALMKEGKPAEAYALLEKLEDKYAGDPRFDYLLGIAALDSGKADRATLAFERVLAVNPDFVGARLDMARAYFQVGDMARAKAEFETVLSQNPPQPARVIILKYLADIAQREKAKLTAISAYVEATFGRDTNVNNSTSQSQVSVPGLGNLTFTLDPTNVQRKDNYFLYAAGGDITHEVTPGVALFAGVNGRYRGNTSEDRFDYQSADIRGGVAFVGQANVVRATLSGEDYYLDHKPNRNTASLGLDWRHIYNQENHFNAFGQLARYRFEQPDLTVNDFDQSVLGVGWTRLFRDGRSLLSAAFIAGHENDVNERADGNKDFRGLRLGGQYNLRDDMDLFAAAGRQKAPYDKLNVAFQQIRDDTLTDATLGLVWRFAPGWSARPQYLYSRNESNIAIYAYKRRDYSVAVRWDFRDFR